MPGELSNGFGPKQRKGAWVFTYAPDAVIGMVRRLRDALDPERKHVADTIVIEAIKTALAMTEAMAMRQRPGWKRWIEKTRALLEAHIEGGLWEFSDGEPVGWRKEGERWTHPNIDRLLAVAPDALDKQVSEDEIFTFSDPVLTPSVAVPTGGVGGTGGDAVIDPKARVAADAIVGPGCRLGPGALVEAGAMLWNTVVEDSTVGDGASVARSVLQASVVGPGAVVRSCSLTDSTLGEGSTADAAAMDDARLAPRSIVSAFADLLEVDCKYPTILGGRIHFSTIDTHLMSMHMAGGCECLDAMAAVVETDGLMLTIPAIPMLGGGSVIRGTPGSPVELGYSFIGSNAIVEQGTYVGFGCFVLGTLGPGAGLLPFTVSTDAEPRRHQVGAVLNAMPSTVMTHFISWTFQAVGPHAGDAIAQMIRHAARDGMCAIEAELARRESGESLDPAGPHGHYRSLPLYTERQLQSGLEVYRWALDSGAWDIVLRDGELHFASKKGRWAERDGSVRWRRDPDG